MTPPSDRERLDAIQQKVDAGCCGALYLDVQFLLDRLAALEHERDELRAELTGTLSEAFQAVPACYDTPADHYREMARRLVEDRDVQKHRARHAEAALLSLQTATQWQPIATAPKDREILVRCRNRAGLPGTVVAHYCDFVEDHPPIEAAWYFWNGGQFTPATQPTHWMPLPEFAALLPDPAGTPSTKDHEDTFARGDGEQLSDRPRTAPTERR